MIAAAHLDNFLFLLFIAVAIFFQLLTRAVNKGRRSGDSNRPSTSPRQTPPSPRRLEETEEDRVRKFLEALGQPTSSNPPPPRPVMRRRVYGNPVVLPRPARLVFSPLPPLTARPPDLPLPPEVAIPESATPPFAPVPDAGPTQPVAQVSKIPEATTDLRTLLKTSAGVREAIILREIFGPPRSMQPLDLLGNV